MLTTSFKSDIILDPREGGLELLKVAAPALTAVILLPIGTVWADLTKNQLLLHEKQNQ
jgi:hypothetical protein